MKINIPDFLIDTNYQDAKLDFKWDGNLEDKITTVAPAKIVDAVFLLNHKAMMGLSCALAELVFWRLHQFSIKEGQDLTDYLHFLEATWAGVINKHYLMVEMSTFEYGNSKVEAVIFNVDSLFRPVANRYVNGSYFTQQFVANLAAIVRHISPNKELFDDWLIDCLKKSVTLFPAQYDARKIALKRATYKNQVYDSSSEPAISREFYFSMGFDYECATISTLHQAYLNKLDYKTNPYLNSPEKMQENGFVGTPYKA